MAEAADSAGGERMVKGLVLGQTLGKGTFGYVKLGTKKETGHQFALKFLKRDVPNFNEKAVKQEIECMKKIRHPNVVALLASTMKCKYPLATGGTENTVLMVMEFANGGDLYDVIYYAGAMDEKMGRTYFKQLLDGCAAIHAAGITHRDLKPNNILIDHKYNLKITDFGLSHIAAEGVEPTQKRMKTSWVGTRGYRAPELVLKARYSNQADVFALGVCLFVMLCARQPFKVASANDPWYKCIATRQFDKYWRSHKSSKLSEEAKVFLQGLMCYQPRERTTIEKAYKEPWMQGEMYSEEQLPVVMREAHKAANDKKAKDPEREKRLQASAPGEKRGDGNPFLELKVPEVKRVQHGWTCYKLNESVECGVIFAFVQDCCAKFMKSEFTVIDDYHLEGTYAGIIPKKGEAQITFNIRIVNVEGQNLFVFSANGSEIWELVEGARAIVLDSLMRTDYTTGFYEEEIVIPEVKDTTGFDFTALETIGTLEFASWCGISEDEGVATDISICSDVQSVCSLDAKDVRSYNKEEVRDWVISTLGEKLGDECKETAKRFFDNAIDGEDLSNFDESDWTEMAPVLGHRTALKEQFEAERKQTSFVDQVFSCLPSTKKYAMYRSIFVSKRISSNDAARLIDKDLEEMGIQKPFHRKKILRKISEILNYSPRKRNSIPTSLSSVPSVPESVSSEIQFSGVRNAISTSPRGSVPDLEIPQNGEVCNLKISARGEACERACECSHTINQVIKRSGYGSEVNPVNQKPRRKCERARRSESQDERSRSYNSPSTVESMLMTKFAEQNHKLRIDALPPVPHHGVVFATTETMTPQRTTDPKSERNLESRTQLQDQELRSRSYESVSTLEAPKNTTSSVSEQEKREMALSSGLLSSVPEALEQPVNKNEPNVRQHEPCHRSRSYSEIDVNSIHLEDPAISDTPNVGCDVYQSMSLVSEETAAGELILVGKKMLDKSDFEAALICFFRARDIDKTRFEPYLFFGKISLQLGDYEDAIEHFTDAIELNTESVKAYCGRGQAYSKVDLVYEAFDDFVFARILDPGSKKAIQGLLGLKDFLNPEYIENSTPGHKFLSNEELKEAVDLWCSTDELETLIKYGHISNWDTSKITSMKELFKDKHEFDDDISDWDVSNVTDMSFMFANACGFNCDISGWDVSNVANMNCIFYGARSFDADVSVWDGAWD